MKPKILFWDTETSLILGGFFNTFKTTIPYTNIFQDWFFICGQWRWRGQKKVNVVSVLDDPKRFKKDHTDDYHVVKTLYEQIEKADIIVAHNGDNFDYKKFLGRLIFHQMDAMPKKMSIDTLKEARSVHFTSRKLDSLCTHLSLTNKLKNAQGCWLDATMGDIQAIKKIIKYGRGDIDPLEELFDRLTPYMSDKRPNMNIFNPNLDEQNCCPQCGSFNYVKNGSRLNKNGVFESYWCKDCNKKFQGKKASKRIVFK